MTRHKKLTKEERAKRAERNERRGRKAERKSYNKPRIVSGAGPFGLGHRSRTPGEGTQRAIKTVVVNAQKWKDSEPCDCAGCVERRRLEEEFKRGKTRLERAR